MRNTAALSTRSSYDVLRRHLESITPWKGRCFARSRHACDGEGNGFDHDRFSLRPLRKRGTCVTNTRKAVCSAYDDSRGWYWAAYKCETWGCNRRIRQRLREPSGRPFGTPVPYTCPCRRSEAINRAIATPIYGSRPAFSESDIGLGELRRRTFGTSVPYTRLCQRTVAIRWAIALRHLSPASPTLRNLGQLTGC